jgi:hypothetical protein
MLMISRNIRLLPAVLAILNNATGMAIMHCSRHDRDTKGEDNANIQ